MIFHLSQASGIPVYRQLIEQVRHAVETGALRGGDRLPTIRNLAADLVINPNTVVRAYRELQREGLVELKQGLGAFVAASIIERTHAMREGREIILAALDRLEEVGLNKEEVRRLVDNLLSQAPTAKAKR